MECHTKLLTVNMEVELVKLIKKLCCIHKKSVCIYFDYRASLEVLYRNIQQQDFARHTSMLGANLYANLNYAIIRWDAL